MTVNENEPLSDQVFHQFLALMRTHRQYARHIVDERGIKPLNLSVLRFLSEHDAVKVSQIQQYLHRSPSTTSALIARLEEDGYVTRTRTSTDRRVVYVTLTEAGREILKQTPLGGMPLLRRELERLAPERLSEMSNVLTELQRLMQGSRAS